MMTASTIERISSEELTERMNNASPSVVFQVANTVELRQVDYEPTERTLEDMIPEVQDVDTPFIFQPGSIEDGGTMYYRHNDQWIGLSGKIFLECTDQLIWLLVNIATNFGTRNKLHQPQSDGTYRVWKICRNNIVPTGLSLFDETNGEERPLTEADAIGGLVEIGSFDFIRLYRYITQIVLPDLYHELSMVRVPGYPFRTIGRGDAVLSRASLILLDYGEDKLNTYGIVRILPELSFDSGFDEPITYTDTRVIGLPGSDTVECSMFNELKGPNYTFNGLLDKFIHFVEFDG